MAGMLAGKTALITGGGTGIGRAIACRFHAEGARIAVAGRRRGKLEETARELASGEDGIITVVGDVTSDDDCRRIVAETVEAAGGLHILVNNAGVMRFAPLHETPIAEWEMMMGTNTFGPWRLMVHAVPHMREAGGGSIVNISSIAGIKAFSGAGAYCTSKAAMQMVSQVMAMEVAADQIRVNCILPALVEDTELSNPIFGRENVADFWARMTKLHPMGRNGKPADIADAALFFASDMSPWVTGTLLSVDGGRHLATNRPADA